MNASIAFVLAQDGLLNGALYALLALALVLVFSVTRIIFLSQGEFVAFSALTLAGLREGRFPDLVWLLVVLGAVSFLADTLSALRRQGGEGAQPIALRRLAGSALANLLYPGLVTAAAFLVPWGQVSFVAQVALVLLIMVPLGLQVYRLAFQPLASSSVLVLLIASVAVHFTLLSTGLVIFGPDGLRLGALVDWSIEIQEVSISGQTCVMLVVVAALIALLYGFFEYSLPGKALRATAISRRGARLVGVGTADAGRLAFGMAAGIGVVGGVLLGSMTSVQYDSGFVVGLKGFVAAIIGGLSSYPLAAAGAVLVGILESYSSFWASSYKEVIVFTLIIPVLAWRSLSHAGPKEH